VPGILKHSLVRPVKKQFFPIRKDGADKAQLKAYQTEMRLSTHWCCYFRHRVKTGLLQPACFNNEQQNKTRRLRYSMHRNHRKNGFLLGLATNQSAHSALAPVHADWTHDPSTGFWNRTPSPFKHPLIRQFNQNRRWFNTTLSTLILPGA